MLSLLWKSFLAVLFPGGLIFLIAIGFLRPQGLPMWLQQPIAALPYIVLTFGLIFGWYFASSRMILSLLVLALADRALVLFPTTGADQEAVDQTIIAITAFLVPLNLLAFSILKEDSLSTLRGLTRVVLVLVQPFLLLWLCLPDQHDLASSFTREYIPSLYMEWTPIPQPALFAFATALLLHVIRFALHRDPLEGGAIWALVAIFVAYHTIRYGWQPTNFFMAAGLILFATLLQSFYQQTYRDELTGIPGRLAYDEAIGQLGKRFSVAVIGIDQLTQYANTHGKPVSEQILKRFAPRVQAACAEWAGLPYNRRGAHRTIPWKIDHRNLEYAGDCPENDRSHRSVPPRTRSGLGKAARDPEGRITRPSTPDHPEYWRGGKIERQRDADSGDQVSLSRPL